MHHLFSSGNPERECRLIFKSPQTVELLSDHLVSELRQDSSDINKTKGFLEESEWDAEGSEILLAVRNNLQGLKEEEHKKIESNLGRLESEVALKGVTARLQGLRNALTAVRKKESPAEAKPVMEQVGDALVQTTETVLPKEWTENMTRQQKITAAAVGTAGVIVAGILTWKFFSWLGNRAKNSAEQGQNAAKKSGGGWMKKILIGTGIGLAAFFGIKWYLDESIKRVYEKSLEAAKDGIDTAKERGREYLDDEKNGTQPWLKYEITEDQYGRAYAEYRKYRGTPENSRSGIETILREDTKLSSEELQKKIESFTKRMEEVFRIEERGDIPYAHSEVSAENYTEEFRSLRLGLSEVVRTHPAETGIVALIAWKAHAPALLLKGTTMTAEHAAEFAKTAISIGADHPLLAVLAGGGALTALYVASKSVENAWMPETLADLQKVGMEGIDQRVLDKLPKEARIQLTTTIEGMKNIDISKLSDAEWIKQELGKIVQSLPEKIKDASQFTPVEEIEVRNAAALSSLANHLTLLASHASKSIEGTKKTADIENAQQALTVFIESMKQSRFSTIESNDVPIKLLESLEQALIPLGLTIKKEKNIVYWVGPDGNKNALCVDPTLKTQSEILSTSRDIISVDGGFSAGLIEFSRSLKALQYGAEQRGEYIPLINQSETLAMISGNFVYILDPRNLLEVIALPVESFYALYASEDREQLGHTAGNIYARTAVFVLSAETISRMSSLIFGGKGALHVSLPKGMGWLKAIVKVPLSPVTQTLPRAYRAGRWARNAWNAYITQSLEHGFNLSDSRHALNAIQRIGLSSNRHVYQLETASGKKLRGIVSDILKKGDQDIPQVSDEVLRSMGREGVMKRMQVAGIKQKLSPSIDFHGTNIKERAYQSIYKPMNEKESYNVLRRAVGLEELPNNVLTESFTGAHDKAERIIEELKQGRAAATSVDDPLERSAASSTDDLTRARQAAMQEIGQYVDKADDVVRQGTRAGASMLDEAVEVGSAATRAATGAVERTAERVAAEKLGSKFVPIGGAIIAAEIGTVRLLSNRTEIMNAKMEGNAAKVSILEAKERTLLMETAFDTATGYFGPVLLVTPAGWVATIGGVGVGVANEMMYARALELSTSNAEYLRMSNDELETIVRTDSERSLQALWALLMHKSNATSVDVPTLTVWIEKSQWAGNPKAFIEALNKDDPAAKKLVREQMYNRNARIVSGQMTMLQSLAEKRYGKKASHHELSKLRPEDYEMASLYSDVFSPYMYDSEDSAGTKARLEQLEKKFAALDTDLELRKPFEELERKGGTHGKLSYQGQELFRLMYKDYDTSLDDKGDLAWALRMDKVLHALPVTTGLQEANEKTKETSYRTFRGLFLRSFLSEELHSIAQPYNRPILQDAVYLHIDTKTRTLFDELVRTDGANAIMKQMEGTATEQETWNAHSAFSEIIGDADELRRFCQKEVRVNTDTFTQSIGDESAGHYSKLHVTLQPIQKRLDDANRSGVVGSKSGYSSAVQGIRQEYDAKVHEYAATLGYSSMSAALLSLLEVPAES